MFENPAFWYLISFIIFLLIIFHPVRKNILPLLDQKISIIKSNTEQANLSLQQAKIKLMNIDSYCKKTDIEIKRILNQAQNDANEIAIYNKEKISRITLIKEREFDDKMHQLEKESLQIIKDEFANSVYKKLIKNINIDAKSNNKIILDGIKKIQRT